MSDNDNLAIAYPYVEAIFALGQKEHTLDAWLSSLAVLAEIAACDRFHDLIDNPQLSKQQILDILLSFIENNSVQLRNLLILLQENKRLRVLSAIFDLFKQKVAVERGMMDATIYSAYPLSDGTKHQLEKVLSARFSKTVTASVVTSPELIGGIKIELADLVIDVSVKNRLANLATLVCE